MKKRFSLMDLVMLATVGALSFHLYNKIYDHEERLNRLDNNDG